MVGYSYTSIFIHIFNGGKKMKKRFVTGLIVGLTYVAVLLLAIYVHEIFFDVFILFLAIMAGLEMSKALANKFGKAEDVFVVLTPILGYLAFYLVHTTIGMQNGGITAFFGVLALMFIACIVYTMISKTKTMRNAVSTMLVMVYPISVLVYMLGLNYLSVQFRVSALLLVFLISCFTDTFAYLVGSTVKGPKLCPKISPKKTVSGAIGGLFGGILGGAVILLFSIFNILNVDVISTNSIMNIIHFLIIGLFGSVFDQIGDLIASYLKRSCGIKDFGNLLPGHGGVLDRIDGLMLNAVFVFIYMTILSLV